MSRYYLPLTAFLCATVTLAAADPAPALNDHMGVATHFSHKTEAMKSWDAPRYIPLIAAMGVGWIRDEITWRDVEPERGKYRLDDNTRAWVDLAHANGIKIIACFADRNPIYDDAWDPDAYARAAAWLARELDGKVDALEILNEPFGSESFTGGKPHNNWTGLEPDGSPSPWLARYVKLLNTAATAIKAANPRMKVIGLGGTTPDNYREIALGISPAVDGITDHPYSFRSPPEIVPYRDTAEMRKKIGFAVADSDGSFASFVRQYRRELQKYHGPSELWFTESGWSTFREGDKRHTYLYSGVNDAAQAVYSQRRLLEGLALGVKVDALYDFLDDSLLPGGDFNPERHFGLVRGDGSPKPAYYAVQSVARATIGFTPGNDVKVEAFPFSDRSEAHPRTWDGEPLPALSRIMLYPFTDADGRAVFAVWSAERPGDLNVRAADIEFAVDPAEFSVEAADLLTGQVMTPAVRSLGGRLMLEQFPVPDHPVLLRLLPRAAKQ